MRPIAYAVAAIMVLAAPAVARDRLRHGRHTGRGHGVPIIAGNNEIRINSVGEVLSTPPPPLSSQSQRKVSPAMPAGGTAKP